MVMLLVTVSGEVSVIVPVKPVWKAIVPFAGMLATASRKVQVAVQLPGPLSARVLTVNVFGGLVGVLVEVLVAVLVAVLVGVCVAVLVGVDVGVCVEVRVSVWVGVSE